MSHNRKSINLTITSARKSNPNDSNTNFTIQFANPIVIPLNSNPKIYPVSFSSEFNWFNVSAQYDNLVLKYYSGTSAVERTVNFPPGQYSAAQLNNYLVAYQQSNVDGTGVGVDFIPDFNYTINGSQGTVTVTINAVGTIVHFSDSDCFGQARLIGAPLSEISVTTEGSHPDITAGVSEIEIHCSLVAGSGVSVLPTDTIMVFQPTTQQPFAKFIIEPSVKTMFSVNPGQVNNIQFRITDQDQRPFDMTGGFETSVPTLLRCVLEYDEL